MPPTEPSSDTDWDGVRLHVVTGKGGTGKTTVAAALALALAAGGRRTLLCEVENRQGIAQLFDVPQLPYEERKIAVAPGGGDVFALAIEPKAALLEYLELFYRLGRAGKMLERLGAVDFATTIAPGVRDVLLTGKVYEAARRRGKTGPVYDAVVLDAPPTGRITQFLNVNEEVVGLAKVGPVRNQAGSIMSLLRSPQTVVHLVTVLEEMPVQETQDGVAQLHEAGLPVGGVVVNMVRDPVLPQRSLTAAAKGRLDRTAVVAGLEAAGLGGRSATLVDGLLAEAGEHALRVALESAQRKELAALERPVYELPALSEGIDLGALYDFAEELREQGMA
ncbi:ArsA-related P-loop ATPase [Kineosporia sp. A_224]|uniref:ArsA-related P-loop ATPase n=1 Tax=Kineosporia sp. A_224 TaxID=1962180 RepID=UPI0018E915CC|nr:ArsA-related P-loop ATPase [Kineosporia sp. A_224]